MGSPRYRYPTMVYHRVSEEKRRKQCDSLHKASDFLTRQAEKSYRARRSVSTTDRADIAEGQQRNPRAAQDVAIAKGSGWNLFQPNPSPVFSHVKSPNRISS